MKKINLTQIDREYCEQLYRMDDEKAIVCVECVIDEEKRQLLTIRYGGCTGVLCSTDEVGVCNPFGSLDSKEYEGMPLSEWKFRDAEQMSFVIERQLMGKWTIYNGFDPHEKGWSECEFYMAMPELNKQLGELGFRYSCISKSSKSPRK